MRTFLKAVCLVVFLGVVSPVVAQWPARATPGVPKTADGKPDLTAPAPRTADGKPDLSGIWTNNRGAAGQRGGGTAANAAPPAAGQQGAGTRGATAVPAAPLAGPDGMPLASFRDVGSGFKDGLPLQPWARELVKKRMADNSKDNPDAHCLPMGFMQFHTHGEPRKIIQTPGVIVIIYEPNSGLRQIFTDGRNLPSKDVEPWWYGYSVGKWEGDTLVVETMGLIDDGWLDINGNPFTNAAKVTEKFRRVNFGTLEIEVTVDDPKAYTRPWTVKVNQRSMLDTELIEFICEDRDATHYVGAQ
jgi:hypothetical protein